MGDDDETTVIPANPMWYVAHWIEPEGDEPAFFVFDDIVAWQINRADGRGWATPITIDTVDLVGGARCIKTPAGKFLIPEEQTFDTEKEASSYFLSRHKSKGGAR